MRRLTLVAGLAAVLMTSTPGAWAGTTTVSGPNSDFPDANIVLPFDAQAPRSTFFAASNLGPDQIDANWFFYDENGGLIAQVTRTILAGGGTDIVDLTNVADRSLNDQGDFVESNSQSLAGHRGFAVMVGNGTATLIASFTIANVNTNAAFGGSGAGFGAVGALAPGATVVGTSFNPSSLQDNELILIGLNPAADGSVTSLTNGNAATPDSDILDLSIELVGNGKDNGGVIASGLFQISGTALFNSLQGLFPDSTLSSSATLAAFGDEGVDLQGSPFDPDTDTFVSIIGFYGQTLGAFGTGQNLRTVLNVPN